MSRLCAAWLAAIAANALLGCGGPTAGPSGTPGISVDLEPGLQNVSFTGLGISSDPQFPPCVPLGVPMSGTGVVTQVVLEMVGGNWIGNSPPGSGDTLEIRLPGTGSVTGSGVEVIGTVTGSAADKGQQLRPPMDVRVTFDGSAAIDASGHAGLLTGRISGTITFTDSKNSTGTCTAVQFLMDPAPAATGVRN